MILLTGITGKVGGAAAAFLLQKGIPFRAIARDPKKASGFDFEGVEIVPGDLLDADDVKTAVRGVTSVLLVTPNGRQQLDMEREFARAAHSAGVSHLVKISTVRASAQATAPFPKTHYRSEEFIKSLDMPCTLLRGNFFMQNFLMSANTIGAGGSFALPMGAVEMGMIDARDVGEIAARALLHTGPKSASYDLSGPEMLDCHAVARRMSSVFGREISYIDQSLAEFRTALEPFIPDTWHLDALCAQFDEMARHGIPASSHQAAALLGRAPRSLDAFLSDYATSFEA